MRQTYLVQRQRGYRAWALAPLLIACLLLAACASSTGRATVSAPTATIPAKWQGVNMGSGAGMPTVTPLADSTPRPLPAFSDPRVAYIGPDSLLHVVSLDGATDLAGTPIPLNGSPMDGIWGAGTSPDGKHLAYFEDARITTIDAASGTRTALPAPGGDSTVGWSPDQRYLTLQEGGAIECVSATNGGSFETPGDPLTLLATSKWQIGLMAGWLDATHIAVTLFPNTSGTPGTHALPPTPIPGSPETYATLASLNITTNQLHQIARIQIGDSIGAFSVLPGGRWTLFANGQRQSDPYTPQADLVNNGTGAVMRLPHLSFLLPPGGFNAILWRPNSSEAVVTLGTGGAHLLIDALHDTATAIALPGVPEAWSPDGSTLVVATSGHDANGAIPGWNDAGTLGSGPFTLAAVRISAHGGVSSSATLTTRAMDVPMLGFVHTA